MTNWLKRVGAFCAGVLVVVSTASAQVPFPQTIPRAPPTRPGRMGLRASPLVRPAFLRQRSEPLVVLRGTELLQESLCTSPLPDEPRRRHPHGEPLPLPNDELQPLPEHLAEELPLAIGVPEL